jgi:predicted Zn-dependent protease
MDALRSQSPQQANRASQRRFWPEGDLAEQGSGSGDEPPQRDSYQETSRHADDLDESEEVAEGRRQQAELLERYPAWSCPATTELLSELLHSLLEHSQRMEIPYEFLGLDTAIPFASSCCHGAVYFSRGLIETLSEPDLTFFGAHEMAHTELRHFASRQRRLEELRRAIPAAPGSAARQRLELAAVLTVRHQEEFEADHLAARWIDAASSQAALERLHDICRRTSPESLNVPTHPPFERRLSRLAAGLSPPDPVEYLWSLVGG